MGESTAHHRIERPGLHIVLLSLHGLVRGHDIELGRDADTGGQITYVVELARTLAARPDVARVDLLTRLIRDPAVSADYAAPREPLAPGAWIVRLPCGPDGYLPKEKLWPHLDEFTRRTLAWLSESGRRPHVIHAHYADAAYVGASLASVLDVPLVFTAHSLGRVKLARLLAAGEDPARLEERFQFRRRFAAEETAMARAALCVASTRQEMVEQYGLYRKADPAKIVVIPPGVDLSRFRPAPSGWRRPAIARELGRFLRRPQLPMILALARPDRRKNFHNLLHAFGRDPELRRRANLVIVAGNRDRLDDLSPDAAAVWREILTLVDDYDLYGSVAVPKHHTRDDVPELYRLAAATGGVLVNPALTEPFGLTLLEAAACGLPVVATDDGGPVDIVKNCRNGLLVDPLRPESIAAALREALADRRRWREWSAQGVRNVRRLYGWPAHAERYMTALRRHAGIPAQATPLPAWTAVPARRAAAGQWLDSKTS